jgi:hypothetical protein
MTARRRVTSSVLVDLDRLVTAGDRAVLETLWRVRLASGPQLQALHHGGDGEAAKQRRIRQLSRMSRLQLVVRLDRRIGGVAGGSRASVYALDVAGLRLVDPTGAARRPWVTSSPFVAHSLAVTQLYVDLVTAERLGRLELIRFDCEPRCWRHFTDRRGEPVDLKPDADVIVGAGEFEHHAFVEIDLATESRPRIRAKTQRYIDYDATGREQDCRGVRPRVVWATTTDQRRQLLAETLAPFERTLPGVFVATTTDRLIDVIGGAGT